MLFVAVSFVRNSLGAASDGWRSESSPLAWAPLINLLWHLLNLMSLESKRPGSLVRQLQSDQRAARSETTGIRSPLAWGST